MRHKKLIYSGTAILVASIVLGTLGIIWFIYSSFKFLSTSENAGIGAVGVSIKYAIFFSIFEIIGILTGLILIIIGAVNANRQSKMS